VIVGSVRGIRTPSPHYLITSPNERMLNVSGGILRASYRHRMTHRVMLRKFSRCR
jgi:hypothetical protein